MNANRITRTALILTTATLLSMAGLFSVYSAPLLAHLHKQAAATPSLVKTALVSSVKPHIGIPVKAADFKVMPHSRRLYINNAKSSAIKPRVVGDGPTILQFDENVQTFDVFAPASSFYPASAELPASGKATAPKLTPMNLYPQWSQDQTYLVFSSNRDGSGAVAADGKFHIWAISSTGSGAAVQITSGNGNEYYPVLNKENSQLLFTSNNGSTVTNLYSINFNPNNGPIDVATLTLPANLKTPPGNTTTPRDFGNVLRATWSPGSNRVVFAAQTISGATAGHAHLYFFYVNTNGYLPEPITGSNPPIKITNGTANDTNPTWSPDGHYIAFDSDAISISNSPSTALTPTNAPSTTVGPAANNNRTVYLIYDGTDVAFGTGARRVTQAGIDSGEPAWSQNAVQDEFTNPNSKFSYLSFARATTPAANHDIYYFRISINVDDATQITPEDVNTNPAVHLSTSEYQGAGETTSYTDAGNLYDDRYPTWSPFRSVFSIAYQSNRTVTYIRPQIDTTPVTAALPLEKALSYGRNSGNVGPNYEGLLQSELLNLNPPTLLTFNGNEVLHINSGAQPILPSPINLTGSATRQNIQPGQTISVTVRLSDREAPIDDTHVFLQIKDPDGKYQDRTLGNASHTPHEHKVYARDAQFQNYYGPYDPEILDSGSSNLLGAGAPIVYDTFDANGNPALDQFGQPIQAVDSLGLVGSGVNHFPPTVAYNRGALGGHDGSDNISVGRDGYAGFPATTNPDGVTPGSDPAAFVPWGPEYECQVVNPSYAGPDTVDGTIGHPAAQGQPAVLGTLGDYTNPYYLAGYDDQTPLSGIVVSPVSPSLSHPARGTTEWLPMHRAATQDNLGGVLYTVAWTTPTSPSDYYLDVIAYDTAKFPNIAPGTQYDGASQNWRIYDNIWGFSTATFDGSNDILVIGDYSLGQKFAASSFGGLGRGNATNLVPTLFGTESYLTDADVNLFPNSVYWHPKLPNTRIQPLGPFIAGLVPAPAYGENAVSNGLGVGSYFDVTTNDGRTQDNAPYVKSQRYSLWRILCRGAVTTDVLAGYLPTTQTQPSITVNGVVIPGKTVTVANRCVIWSAPYAGDLFVGPGTIADPTTRPLLKNFVAARGRLCVTGQNVATAITGGDATSGDNQPTGFLQSVLSVIFTPNNIGSPKLSGSKSRLSGGSQSPHGGHGYGEFRSPGAYFFGNAITPQDEGLVLPNNVVDYLYVGEPIYPVFPSRGDASLSQFTHDDTAPNLQGFALGSSLFKAHIDTVTPVNGATLDTKFSNGNAGLIYNAYASGGRSIFASFGLEGLSIDYYETTITGIKYFNPHNTRPYLLHNIVSYLRTGSITGTIFDARSAGGQGVANATVYVTGEDGKIYSATTTNGGGYAISGLEPDQAYFINVYKTGYTSTGSEPTVYYVEGDTSISAQALSIGKLTPGSISGKVTDATTGSGISGATVTFISSDQQVTKSTITGPDGTYTIGNVDVGTYTGTASSSPLYVTSGPQTVTVTSGANTVANFGLQPFPATISGKVTNAADGKPIAGATVTAVRNPAVTPVPTATTAADGTYKLTNVSPGNYTITATATGFKSNSISVSVAPNDALTGKDIALTPIPPGTLGGLVKDSNGNIVSGALITVKNAAGAVVATPVTTATTTSPTTPNGDGSPINYSTPLPIGTYTVTATKTGLTAVQATAVITTGAFKRVNLTFIVPPPTGNVGGVVRDCNNTAVSGVLVTIKNSAGTVVATVTTGTITSPTAPNGDGASINYHATVSVGNYTVTATKTGYTTVSGTVTITANAFKRLDLKFPAIHTFPQGLNFVSTPYDYTGTSIDTLFGTMASNRSHVAIYQPLISNYVLDPTSPADSIHIGLGYWVRLTASHGVPYIGTVPTAATVAVGLSPGWNMIGVPATVGIPVANLKFANPQDANSPLTFADASGPSYNLVNPILYAYNQSTNAYQSIDSTSTLQPWQAYWIKAKVSTTILIPTR